MRLIFAERIHKKSHASWEHSHPYRSGIIPYYTTYGSHEGDIA